MTFYRSNKNKKLITTTVDIDSLEMKSPESLVEEIENKELNDLILSELELMNKDFKEVFILREYSGLSYREISSILDIEEDLVKSRLYKARQKLTNTISTLVD